jgi:chromate reductase, NAD(P)H dehydrogenase (quinone)
MAKTVAVLVGSLRRDSFSKKTAAAIAKVAPEGLKFEHVPIGNLPFYSEDLESETPPQAWADFRNRIKTADALLFVTPEYNRSVPAVLKNAIDVGSRPYGQSVFSGKPAAVVSISVGGVGGFGANHHLRQSLVFLNVPTLQHEAYIGNVASLFDEEGQLKSPGTEQFLREFAASFKGWIERNS